MAHREREWRGESAMDDGMARRVARSAARHACAGSGMRTRRLVDLSAARVRRVSTSRRCARLAVCAEFFDAIVSIDSFFYYGTDDTYLSTLARFVKPGRQIGIAG